MRTSKLHIVDLAGSERVKDSGVSGKTLKEAIKINLSLFYLSGVVNAFADKSGKNSEARRRAASSQRTDKLCMFLRDAIGGDSKTFVVATVSPSQEHAR